MRKYEERGQFHERRQPYRRPRVVAEYEKRRAKWPQFGQRESVDDRGHCVLANAEVQVLSSRTIGLKVPRAREGERSLIRRTQVGGTAKEPWNVLCKSVQRFT